MSAIRNEAPKTENPSGDHPRQRNTLNPKGTDPPRWKSLSEKFSKKMGNFSGRLVYQHEPKENPMNRRSRKARLLRRNSYKTWGVRGKKARKRLASKASRAGAKEALRRR